MVALGLLPAGGSCVCRSGEYRSYVENSIVDASIFLVETAAFCEVVVIRGKTMFVVRSRFAGRMTTIGQFRRASSGGTRVGCGGSDSNSCCVSSFEEQTVDALATGAEEGRSNLR